MISLYDSLSSEIQELTILIKSCPSENVIELSSLDARLRKAQKELSKCVREVASLKPSVDSQIFNAEVKNQVLGDMDQSYLSVKGKIVLEARVAKLVLVKELSSRLAEVTDLELFAQRAKLLKYLDTH